jgi:peptidoglycan-associated lipoprotein
MCKTKIIQCTADPVLFSYNRANIKRGENDKLNTIAECLKGDNTAPVTIAGHCDERGTQEYNMALGERRAQSARKYLERLGVAGNKLNTVSYGKERPAAEGSNEKSWKQNRRAEFSAR